MVNVSSLCILCLFCQQYGNDFERTSNIVEGCYVASRTDTRTGTDEIWLAKTSRGTQVLLTRIPVSRRDRNVADHLHIRKRTMVIQVNTAVTVMTPYFFRQNHGSWELVRKPKALELSYGSENVIVLSGKFVGLIRAGTKLGYFLYVFGESGLKLARIPVIDSRDTAEQIHFVSRNAFELTFWRSKSDGEQLQYKKQFRWPLTARHGYWQLRHVKPPEPVRPTRHQIGSE